MKEITSFAFNYISQIPIKPGRPLTADIEVAIVVSEPVYRLNNQGEPTRDRVAETIRFVSSPDNLRALAKGFSDAAAEAETAIKEALRENADAEIKAVLQRQREVAVQAAKDTPHSP